MHTIPEVKYNTVYIKDCIKLYEENNGKQKKINSVKQAFLICKTMGIRNEMPQEPWDLCQKK